MTTYQLLCLIGVPAIVSGMYGFILAKIKGNEQKSKAIETGLQAMLRGQMINDYNKWIEKGYAPIYAKENFDNMYQQYHNLGANGVMDRIYEEFMQLPTIKPSRKSSQDR